MRKLTKTWVLSIDPSINFLGWALWKKGKLHKYGLLQPSKNSLPYLDKCKEMISGIRVIIYDNVKLPKINSNNHFDYIQIVTEIPDHFASAGYMSRESGAIAKLAFLAGMIYGLTNDTHAYLPREWKGNLKKHACALRMAKANKEYDKIFLDKEIAYCKDCGVEHRVIKLRHDIIDAIGIGHKYIYGKI